MIGPALCLTGSLTGVVPAASGGGSSPPAAIELGQSPLRDGVVAQGVGSQVTDLQSGVMSQEVRERHPGRQSREFHSCRGPDDEVQVVWREKGGKFLPELSVL